jgi:hypothetical protein
MPELAANPLIQNGGIDLDPTPDRAVVHGQTALGHDSSQITVAERVSQIPPHMQKDDHVLEVPPTEQCWPFLPHGITYQISPAAIATDPSAVKRF